MRSSLLLIVSLLITPTVAFAQRRAATAASPDVEVRVAGDEPTKAKKSYLIELVEFRFGEAPVASLTAEEILNRLSKADEGDGVEVIQTLHLLAVEGQQSTVEAGLQTAITAGVTYARGREAQAPPLRNLQQTSLGSALNVTAEPADEQVQISLSYSVSRIQGERPEDGPPDIISFTLQSQVLVTPGQRVLLGGANGTLSSYAAITLTER